MKPHYTTSSALLLSWLIGCASTPTAPIPDARFAAWTGEGFNGRRISTEHFEIISTLADAELESGLPTFLEDAFRAYTKTLPMAEPLNQPLTTYVFGLRDEWLRFMRVRFPLRSAVYARIRSGGFTEGTTSVSFYTNRGVTLATLAHEGWHQYLSARLDRPVPAWINEGLACTFESFDMRNGRPRFIPRRNSFRINSLREAIQRDRLLSLSEIIDTDAGEVILNDRTKKTDTYYAQAWALMTFLRHGAGGRYAPAFDRMMGDIASGTFHARISASKLTGTSLPPYQGGIEGGSPADERAVAAESRAVDDPTIASRKSGDSQALPARPLPISDGRAALIAYFQTTPEELQEEYYDHLIRVTGF